MAVAGGGAWMVVVLSMVELARLRKHKTHADLSRPDTHGVTR